MTELREFTFHANDLDGDGVVDADGLNAPVIGEFPLEPGEEAQVFLRLMVFEGTDGAGGGIFRDIDGSRIYVSDDISLQEGDSIPEPVNEELPLDDTGDPGPPVISIAPECSGAHLMSFS